MKILICFFLISTAYGSDFECVSYGRLNAIKISHDEAQLYKVKATRIMRGDFITYEEIGSPFPVRTIKSGLRVTYTGQRFELVTKAGVGILTRIDETEIKEKDYFCEERLAPGRR
jgi:hypothetical protein